MIGANLRESYLREVNLIGANLSGTILDGVKTMSADLTNIHIQRQLSESEPTPE